MYIICRVEHQISVDTALLYLQQTVRSHISWKTSAGYALVDIFSILRKKGLVASVINRMYLYANVLTYIEQMTVTTRRGYKRRKLINTEVGREKNSSKNWEEEEQWKSNRQWRKANYAGLPENTLRVLFHTNFKMLIATVNVGTTTGNQLD